MMSTSLKKEGVFLYPKDSSHRHGKLRLMYKANPLSYIIEQAGESSHSGTQRILIYNKVIKGSESLIGKLFSIDF